MLKLNTLVSIRLNDFQEPPCIVESPMKMLDSCDFTANNNLYCAFT